MGLSGLRVGKAGEHPGQLLNPPLVIEVEDVC
jgi:hypothetical protein